MSTVSTDELIYNPEEQTIKNDQAKSFVDDLRRMHEETNARIKVLEQNTAIMNQKAATNTAIMQERIDSLKRTSEHYLLLRKRAVSTWIRDAYHDEDPERDIMIHRLNKDIVHYDDILTDAIIIKRDDQNSREVAAFPILYGMEAEDMQAINRTECSKSSECLNYYATKLMKYSTTEYLEHGISQALWRLAW